MYRIPALLALAIVSSQAAATEIPLSYAVIGTGGLSDPKTGIGSGDFWWIDTTGNVSAATATTLADGFQPLPSFDKVIDVWGQGLNGGSLLLSSEFTLGTDDTLELNLLLLKSIPSYLAFDATGPGGFAVLLEEGQAPTVLANVTADGEHSYALYGHDNPSSPSYLSTADRTFAPTSPGVTVSETPGSGLALTLGAFDYGVVPAGGLCGCFLDVRSSFQPGAGTYQLLLGSFDYSGFGALAVTRVQSVPEPATLLLLSSALAGLAFTRRRRTA